MKTTNIFDLLLIVLLFVMLFLLYKSTTSHYQALDEIERYERLIECYEAAFETKINAGKYDHRSFRYMQAREGQ